MSYATAMAMRAFIGTIALTFLGLALLGAFGDTEVWTKHIAPAIEPKLTHATYVALNTGAQKIFASDSSGLIVFASLYAVWQISGSVRAVMDALNEIIGCEETRTTVYRLALSMALAVVVILLIACALFVVAVTDRLLGTSGGVVHWIVGVLRWPAGAVFLGLAVGVVARFAPVEHRGVRWASVGAGLIVFAWLVTSAAYAWFLQHALSFRSASSNLLLVVVVTTYLYFSSIIFLVGAQLDEFLRQEGKGREVAGIPDFTRRLF